MMNRLILATAALLALTAGVAAAPIKLATEGAYPPFNFLNDDGTVGGFEVELGNELCKRAGLDCTWVTNELDNIVGNLVANDYDAVLADLTITDERKQTIDFSDPYFPPDLSTYMSLAAKKIDYKNLKDLKIGFQTGTPQGVWLSQNLKDGNTLVDFTTEDLMLAALQDGTIDVMLAQSSYIGEQVSGSNGALKADGPSVQIGVGPGIGLRKGDADLKAKFNTALASVKADGWLDALISKDFKDIWPGPYFKN